MTGPENIIAGGKPPAKLRSTRRMLVLACLTWLGFSAFLYWFLEAVRYGL